MKKEHYNQLERLKQNLDNKGLIEAIDILMEELRLSNICIKEGFEE